MKTLSAKITECFQRVRLVNEFHWEHNPNAHEIPASVDDLQWAIEQLYKVKVEKYAVSFSGDFVRAMYERYEDGSVKIYVKGDLSDQWKRYLAVKELCHVVIDDSEDFEPNGCDIIEHLISVASLPAIDDNSLGDVKSEKLAEIMALEWLYPHEFRKADAAKLAAGETTKAMLADRYGLPEFLVAWVLQPTYIAWSDDAWNRATALSKPKAAE